ncbi:MAG: hypothetical protein ACRETW_11155 [Stenotrophobium sp.]
MNWPIAIAGGMSLVGAAVHGIIGDLFLRKVARDALPANALGGPENSRTLVRVSWHFVTVTFAVSGFALLYVGSNGTTRLAAGVVWFLGALYACFALFAVAVAVQRQHRQLLFTHPAPLGLSAIAVLIWWGVTRM